MQTDGFTIEERLGTLIVEGQRHGVWIRSEPDADGVWHNAVVFRRDGVLSNPDAWVTGLEWHLPPGIALARGQELDEKAQVELFHRAQRPRPPLL
ncbi:MAG: hypothetical protein ACRELD_07780 [Longimicrobiales bacterium]